MSPEFPRHDDVFIVPSVLSADFTCLSREIKSVEKYSGWIQIDVMDGHFVPNLSFGPHVTASLRKLTSLPLDVHLMVEKPLDFVDAFKTAGADLISCHIESKNFQKAIKKIRSMGLKAGLALNPSTPFSRAIKYLSEVDLLLIMTVNPGFGGQKFIEEMYSKIRKASDFKKKKGAKFYIQVDGGVGPSNAVSCIEAGANSLVMGSAVFKEKNPAFIRAFSSSLDERRKF
ncbi:MAG: ribulose-phosphate 3-epimerase [Elusimicrobiota bacterium]